MPTLICAPTQPRVLLVIYRTIARNFLVTAHNLLLVPFLLVGFGVPLTPAIFLVFPALFFIALNGVLIGMLIGPLCARFRDLPPIIASVTQLAFFVTPVMYRPAQLQERLWAVTHLNPFASFMEIVRAPLLGIVPDRAPLSNGRLVDCPWLSYRHSVLCPLPRPYRLLDLEVAFAWPFISAKDVVRSLPRLQRAEPLP